MFDEAELFPNWKGISILDPFIGTIIALEIIELISISQLIETFPVVGFGET